MQIELFAFEVHPEILYVPHFTQKFFFNGGVVGFSLTEILVSIINWS